ncbi:MAG: ABC transporter ATP-binding protein [Pseudomonadota bacterium]
MSELLRIDALDVAYASRKGLSPALRGVSFALGAEKVGIVGESGSGKSTTGRAILRLLPRAAKMTAKTLKFQEVDLAAASEREMRRIRGARISMILQDPKYALNPLKTVGAQITESWKIHHPATSRAELRDRALDMLEKVKIRNPSRVHDLFPHEVSGGMGQRVMIAMMMVPEPRLIIADEPTSALDVTVRRSVLDTLAELVEERGAGLIFISHDLPLVARFCDRIVVMYAGRIVEEIAASDLKDACHPYTQGLLASLPPLDRQLERLSVPVRDPAWLTGPVYRNGAAA